MSKRDDYVAELKTKLDKWNAEIAELEARATARKAETRVEVQKGISELERKRSEARRKLEEMQSATGEAWEALKTGADRIWSEMANAVEKTREALMKERASQSR